MAARTRSRRGPLVTQDDMRAGLSAVGLAPGDAALVHSSLSAFGFVEGGADAVIDALLETVGPGGTIAMPTFTWGRFHDKQHVVFDVQTEPSETGAITEAFRNREQAVRSRHVCHSVAAVGPRAREVAGDGRSSFGRGSTFDALRRLNGWVLLLGADFSVCTALHAVEEHMQVPYRQHRDFRGSTVVLPDGTRRPCESVEYLRKPGYYNDLAKMGEVFAAAGILRSAVVGQAAVTSVRIRDLFAVTRRHLEADIGFLLTAESRKLLGSSVSGGSNS